MYYKKLDIKKLIEYINTDDILMEFGALSQNDVCHINLDMDSIQKALQSYEKVFLELGIFSHD